MRDFSIQRVPIIFKPSCIQRDNFERRAGQARRYGKGPFVIGTTERNLVSEHGKSPKRLAKNR